MDPGDYNAAWSPSWSRSRTEPAPPPAYRRSKSTARPPDRALAQQVYDDRDYFSHSIPGSGGVFAEMTPGYC
jgi:hypothetical protein